MKTLSAA